MIKIYLRDGAKAQLENVDDDCKTNWFDPIDFQLNPMDGFTCEVYVEEEENERDCVKFVNDTSGVFYPDRHEKIFDVIERINIVNIDTIVTPNFKSIPLEIGERPWGTYEVLVDSKNCKVKRITVKSGGRLSLQYHHHRKENWTVVSGEAHVVLGNKQFDLTVGESITIEPLEIHRVGNLLEEDLIFIEVQTGSYFGEDDIVRIQDDYKRD